MYYNPTTGQVVRDGLAFAGPDAISYPGNWNRDECPFLVRVSEVPRPIAAPGTVIVGFHIDGSHAQVWDTRPMTSVELAAEAERAVVALKSDAQTALTASDRTALRCLVAGTPVPTAWVTYRAALRSIVSSGTGGMPDRPDYPAGT